MDGWKDPTPDSVCFKGSLQLFRSLFSTGSVFELKLSATVFIPTSC